MMSFSCTVGIAAIKAFFASRVFVFCSYANANPIKSNSLNADAKKDNPMGTPGAGYTVSGPALPIVTLSG
jgi:hypothetical protein